MPYSKNGGTSQQTKIIIGVIIPVTLILAGLAIWFVFRQSRKKKGAFKARETGAGDEGGPVGDGKGEESRPNDMQLREREGAAIWGTI